MYMLLYGSDWLALSCFTKWVFLRLHERDAVDEAPYITYSTIEEQSDNTRPFRALVGMMLAVSKDVDVPSNADLEGRLRPVPVTVLPSDAPAAREQALTAVALVFLVAIIAASPEATLGIMKHSIRLLPQRSGRPRSTSMPRGLQSGGGAMEGSRHSRPLRWTLDRPLNTAWPLLPSQTGDSMVSACVCVFLHQLIHIA